jgi:hypothetical protein
VARYGRQPRGEGRQVVTKKPGFTTLGNIDWALSPIWDEAVAAKVVERRRRPVIDKTIGEDTEPRAFIDDAGVRAVMRVMTDEWIKQAEWPRHRRQAVAALLSSTHFARSLSRDSR